MHNPRIFHRPLPLWVIACFLTQGLSCVLAGEMVYAGPPVKAIKAGMEKSPEPGSEPVTFHLRGELIALEDGLYGIRDSDGMETTVVTKKGTVIHGNPKVGDQVDVEYLENGTALVIMVNISKSRPGEKPKGH